MSRDRDLDDELQFHIDHQIEANISSGMTPEAARTAALRAFGGVQQQKEACRDTRRVAWIVDAGRDLRHGGRLLARSPLFAIAAVLSLAVGIAANVSMFSIVDALLLKPLPVREPKELVYLVAIEETYRTSELSYAMFERLRDRAPQFAGFAATWPIERANLSIDGAAAGPPIARVSLVSGGYFSTFGIDAAIGRTLSNDDDAAGRPVVVISDQFWRGQLNADPNATSHTLHLNGLVYDIVGVMPQGFSGEWVGVQTDFWVPYALASKVMPDVPQGPRAFPARIFARRLPGWTIPQATAALSMIYQQASAEDAATRDPRLNPNDQSRASVALVEASRGYSPQRTNFGQSLLILMAAVALLLVVACANLANLLLARSSTRQRELAVRLAVGAGRGRIFRQMLTESALVALLGGVAGLAIASWAIGVLSSLLGAAPVALAGQSSGLQLDLRIDPRVVIFATAICAITAMLSGLAPAIAAQRIAPASALRANRTLGLGRFGGPSALLLVGQVSVSLILLIGAGLFVASLRNLRNQDVGLDREHGLLVWTVPGQTGIKDDAMVDLWRRIQERLSAVPGASAVGMSNQAVLNGGGAGSGTLSTPMVVLGEPPRQTTLSGGRSFITPGFFDAAGVRIVAGRDFTEADRESAANVAIINASMARAYFGSEAAAIGRMVLFQGPNKLPHEIVGVNADYVRTSPRGGKDFYNTYFPYRHAEAINRGQQSRLRVMLIAIRVTGNPLAIADAVRAEIRAIDPALPVLRINTTDQQLDDVLAQERLVASLSSALGVMAMFLASLGLFGLLSYRVARRTNEIGVRLAFGATRGAVLRMVLGECARLISAGMVAGVIAALMLARFVSSRLYGVSATDPWAIGGAMVLLTAVACLAALIPARQAAAVDPAIALRAD